MTNKKIEVRISTLIIIVFYILKIKLEKQTSEQKKQHYLKKNDVHPNKYM